MIKFYKSKGYIKINDDKIKFDKWNDTSAIEKVFKDYAEKFIVNKDIKGFSDFIKEVHYKGYYISVDIDKYPDDFIKEYYQVFPYSLKNPSEFINNNKLDLFVDILTSFDKDVIQYLSDSNDLISILEQIYKADKNEFNRALSYVCDKLDSYNNSFSNYLEKINEYISPCWKFANPIDIIFYDDLIDNPQLLKDYFFNKQDRDTLLKIVNLISYKPDLYKFFEDIIENYSYLYKTDFIKEDLKDDWILFNKNADKSIFFNITYLLYNTKEKISINAKQIRPDFFVDNFNELIDRGIYLSGDFDYIEEYLKNNNLNLTLNKVMLIKLINEPDNSVASIAKFDKRFLMYLKFIDSNEV